MYCQSAAALYTRIIQKETGVNIKRFFKKLGATFALAVGVYKGADACAPAPALTPVFNGKAVLADSAIPNQYRLNQLQEPTAEEAKTLWRVRVGAWEIGAGGHHTFLEFSPYSEDSARVKNRDIYQIHGIACDEVRRTWAEMNPGKKVSYDQYLHGDYVLKAMGVNQDHERKFFADPATAYVDIYYGTKDEVLKMYLDGMNMVDKISRDNKPYLLFDHNSNSTERSVREGLGLPDAELFVPYLPMKLGGRIWAPGLEKSLIPAGWDRADIREKSDYKNFSVSQLEQRARDLSGEDKMFATFRPLPPPQSPKP